MQHAEFIVIGAGPGGNAAAFRAADLGLEVVLVDPRPSLGGVCLNEGCIPSKALLHAAEVIRAASRMQDWGIKFPAPEIDLAKLRAKTSTTISRLTSGLSHLAARRKIKVVQGTAAFAGPNLLEISTPDEKEKWRFDQAVISVGSRPIILPDWPSDDPRILDSSDALALPTKPERLAIVGGGIIGLEMATVYSALGSQVVIIELGSQIIPGVDPKAAEILHAALKEHGCEIHRDTRVSGVVTSPNAITLRCEGGVDGEIIVDAVIQAVGRRANGNRIEARKAGVDVFDDGIIAVDRQCRTNIAHIFAVGDVTGPPMLAHRASHQGKIAAEAARGHNAAFDTSLIPSVAYTSPELAWVGLMEAEAKAQDISHRVAAFPWSASGRNLATGGGAGLTRLVYCPDTHRVLGGVIVGAHAGELIAEIVLAIEMAARLEDLALTIHAHPSLSETTSFAAELALGTCTDL